VRISISYSLNRTHRQMHGANVVNDYVICL
jgi:hypothetical protein